MFKKHFKRLQTQPNIFICLLEHADEGPLANIKIECQRQAAKLLISGRSGTQCIAMVNFVSGTLSIVPKIAVVMSIIIIKNNYH